MSDERFATTGIGNGIVSLTDFGSTGHSKVVALVAALKQGCAASGIGPKMVSDESIVFRDCKEVLLLNASGVSSHWRLSMATVLRVRPSAQCGIYMPASDRTAVASGAPLVAVSLPAIKVKSIF